MHNKDNLEEFFKNTIDEFNDAPSDKVWGRLEQNLSPQPSYAFNHKLLLPFFMSCLILITTFAVFSNISLQQKTEKLTAQIEEKRDEMIDLQNDYSVAQQMYLNVEDYMETYCRPTRKSPFSQELPFRDEDIIPTREL